MVTSSNKAIEHFAVNALENVLFRCPFLEPFFDKNDKTPSWDGCVHVHESGSREKQGIIRRAPVQIKGTEKTFNTDEVSFSCRVSDLKNYYMDGGCIFFLVSVFPATNKANIYYSSLHVVDLKRILDRAGKQKNIRIKLDKFPQHDVNEIASIFMSFVENSRKQTSFIGRKTYTLDELGVIQKDIESFSFSAYGVGRSFHDIGTFISTHDFYLYAKPKGGGIDVPVEKISNLIVSRPIQSKVQVKDKEYFGSFNVLYEKGNVVLQIGKGITILLNCHNNNATVNFKPIGTLSDYIRDTSLLIDMIENHEISLNGYRYSLNLTDSFDLNSFKDCLDYDKDIKRMFDFLGVTEELQCDNLSDKDRVNIRNFVNAILYGKGIGFSGVEEEHHFGAFKIANLSIWIWATKREDGYYQIESFFGSHDVIVFTKDNSPNSKPIPVSHYVLLSKEAFIHASNMDYELIKKDICSMDHHPLLIHHASDLMLKVLLGYDEQNKKDERLLDLAESICDWLALDKENVDRSILRLNQLQIAKRRRILKTREKIELGKLTEDNIPAEIRCGAFLLLDDADEAQKCFDELSREQKKCFITYPICHFGKLTL